ncbi:MAG: chromosomal replication initiator protein DnaA [bacterium]|nr:chromosomal replication initiator protein DnaA [bacterium]
MENHDLWRAALAEIELAIPRASFVTWFKGTSIAEVANGSIVISVPNGFAKEWLQNKYNRYIVRALRGVGGETVKEISYVIGKTSEETSLKSKDRTNRAALAVKNEISVTAEEVPLKDFQIDPETGLNPRYTFDGFVVGSFNDLAHAAAQAIIKNLGSAYNPLFIHGGVGLGKTHLIQAIGNEVLKQNPSKKVKYMTSEKYMGELVEALNNQTMNQFKDRYRKFDLLIVDDIQFLGQTEKLQVEFFHTFNTLYQLNKQLVISSDRPPSAVPTLDARLRSRFEGGMLADVGEPDFETRLTILKAKISQKGVSIPEESLKYIALNIKNNIRELEGALNRLILNSKMNSLPLDLEETKRILAQVTQAPKRFTSPKKIIKTVADFYEILEKELITTSRRKEIVKPRQIAMYLLRDELKCSFPFIGDRLGKKDHTTAIHAYKKIDEELKKNTDLQNELKIIKEKIYSA